MRCCVPHFWNFLCAVENNKMLFSILKFLHKMMFCGVFSMSEKKSNKIHNSTFRIKIQNLCLEHNFPNETEKLPRYIRHLLFHRIWKSVLSWISLTYSTILKIPLLESTFSDNRQVTCYAFWIINCLKILQFFCLLAWLEIYV